MDLTKKSASDIERINKYKRVILRFMKEIGLIKYWIDYLQSKEYEEFAKYYVKEHTNHSTLWYDRESCITVVGCCAFDDYLKKGLPTWEYFKIKDKLCDYFHILFAFIQIFWPSEIETYANTIWGRNICDFSYKDLIGRNDFTNQMINKWLKQKEIFGGYED